MDKEKLFRDPVHNYIKIPSSLCDDFIDSYLFQRLRAIEQTSMRCLYPGARHDRFIHSLGTYHLATQIYSVIENDIASHCNCRDKDDFLSQAKNTFLIAALLHDCAHSPFSHTGEFFTENCCENIIIEKIKDFYKDTNLPLDLSELDHLPAVHELASAYVGARLFKQKLKKHNVDSEQFARMITGIKNQLSADRNDCKIKIYNFLIPLINGFIIDVDRLDYLLRDTWASGVSNARVDIVRLLSGIKLNWDTGEIEIKNQSLSSLINAVKARDFIFQWILPHHKVAYSDYILRSAIQELLISISQKHGMSAEEIGGEIFSPERFFTPYTIEGDFIYMPTDGDIIYLIKKHVGNSSYATQVLAREGHLQPLWKSVPEFTTLFPPPALPDGVAPEKFYLSFWGGIQKTITETLSSRSDFLVLKPRSIKKTEHYLQETKISVENSPIGLENISLKSLLPEAPSCGLFYLFAYVPKDAPKADLIKRIKDVYNDCLKVLSAS